MAVYSGWFTNWFPFQTATTSTLFCPINKPVQKAFTKIGNKTIAIQGNPVGLD